MNRKRILFIILSIAVLTITQQRAGHSHTGVAYSNPANGATIKKAPKEIEIQFNAAVQLDTAKAQIRFIGDKNTPVTEVNRRDVPTEKLTKTYSSSNDNKVIFKLPDLPSGLYAVDWSVVEQAGHANNSQILFKVTDGVKNSSTKPVAATVATILVIVATILIRRRKNA